MERKPIILNTDYLNKKYSNLYYKKIVYRKKQLSLNNSIKSKNHNHFNFKKESLNIKSPTKVKSQKEIYSILNIKYNQNKQTSKKYYFPNKKINSIILIQKFIRLFLTRKKIEKCNYLENKKKVLSQTATPKLFLKKKNINIFDAIRKSSKNQKNSIKMSNNKLNSRNTVNNKIREYKKHIIYINKSIPKQKNYSFDHNKNISKLGKKALNKNENIINKKEYNKNIILRNENQNSIHESDFSMSNLFTEQYPQNLNSNKNNKDENITNNLNINDEYLENNKIWQTEVNDNLNRNFNKNKKNNILNGISSYQTKENSSSDRNITLENNNNIIMEIQNNKKKNFLEKKTEDNNSNLFLNKKKDDKKEKKEDEDNNNLDFSIDFNSKDEFDTDANYQINKKNLNLINANIKYNFNPMINSKLSLKNINKIHKNNDYFNDMKNNIISNEGKKIYGGIKEEKKGDNDLVSLKSSFYDEEEFIIINYDYTLNDKKKLLNNSLKISNVEEINITGRKLKKIEGLEKFKNIILKKIAINIFNFLKKIRIDDENEDEKSLTDNESCAYISEGRIEKNRIIFDYAKNDMKYNK